MLGDEPSVHIPIHKVLDLQDHLVVLGGRGHPRDDQLIQSALHPGNRLRPVLSPHYELSQEGVIVGRHLELQKDKHAMLAAHTSA